MNNTIDRQSLYYFGSANYDLGSASQNLFYNSRGDHKQTQTSWPSLGTTVRLEYIVSRKISVDFIKTILSFI